MTKLVIDLSKWNTITSYKEIAKNVNGVIIRAGYRSYKEGNLTEDPKFKEHIEGCIAAKIPVGIYFFTTAINRAEARQEAEYAVSLIKKYNLAFPIFVDTEMSNNQHSGRSDSIGKVTRTEAVVGFCERIKELGYVPGIYASDSWFVSQIDFDSVKQYKLWVASYSRSPYRVPSYVGWQFTSKHSIPGVSGNVDASYWYDEIGNPKKETEIKKNPYLKPSTTVRKGMKGQAVKWVQWELVESGYKIAIDGDFGPKTLAAVKDFQKKHGLKVDGLVGPITIATLIGQPTNKVVGATMNNLAATSAIYSADAMLDYEDKVDFGIDAEFIATGVPMYRTIFSLFPFTVIHGRCKVLSEISITKRIKVIKISTIDGEYIGWFKYKDVANLFN